MYESSEQWSDQQTIIYAMVILDELKEIENTM